jgi:hypothetical protein
MGQVNSVPAGIKGGALGLLVMAMGGFIVAVGTGMVPVPDESIHAPRWVIVVAGLAFVFAGVSVVQQAFQIEAFKYVPGLVIVLALAAVANWVAFGPGDRSGEGTLTVVGIPIPVTSQIAGRVAFGFGAVVIDLLLVAGLVHWFRNRSGTARPSARVSLRTKQRPAARPSASRSPAR